MDKRLEVAAQILSFSAAATSMVAQSGMVRPGSNAQFWLRLATGLLTAAVQALAERRAQGPGSMVATAAAPPASPQ